MHKLKPITPLGADASREDQIGTITITEVVNMALASVAARLGQEKALHAALLEAVSLTLPDVGKSTETSEFTALWTGPDQWMIVADHDQHELLATELKQMVGTSASVVEQTDGWCRFDVSGERLGDLFERLSNVPVRRMNTGDVIRGTVEHLGAFLWRLEDARMAVIAPRSSAASLHHALKAAATSIS
ncbi:sarcosine oxidase subunit gamma [Aliiroseovarius sp. KMU-50]|uniref:Sarcosine oxidase subunit gamma n=1 Tax=Aliiroseovarius salicola TaxID=3009082 RepID=A0ABT4W1Y3_9RHOB|nr:sarcosine oxidase subunit gamma [Aliiroseovarius sp. KMU-50]MDA5094526.1 sarcosine oxidase subunit gamma [Aliiroseovarius sp. KMU-50]